jgi:glycine cleavage system aminomethyltransferase T
VLEDPDVMIWGGELVRRDGGAVGQVTSAAYSATLRAGVGLAYVWARDGAPINAAYVNEGRYEINVGGRITPARLSLRALYDPDSAKIKR